MKTLIKTKNFDIHVSGSLEEPYTHIYFKFKGKSKPLNIFPYLQFRKQQPYCKKFIGVTHEVPKFLQWLWRLKAEYEGYCYFNYDDEKQVKLKDPHFILWVIGALRNRYIQKHCKHEWEVESHISPDSGSEDFTCKKCGVYHHIRYY